MEADGRLWTIMEGNGRMEKGMEHSSSLVILSHAESC